MPLVIDRKDRMEGFEDRAKFEGLMPNDRPKPTSAESFLAVNGDPFFKGKNLDGKSLKK